MRDVRFGYVLDLGTGEEWWARSGEGAFLDGAPLAPPAERRIDDGRLELVAIEAASTRLLAVASPELAPVARRIRAIGSIAISLCQLAATRVDAMMSLWQCRGVDAAAAQLIVRESGGLVAFPAGEDPLGAAVGVEASSAVVAARTAASLAELARVAGVLADAR
jgi:myo-inositol-1(or 4)-monophosphatase